ncbi:hypothetical protein ACFL2H_07340, partial [Planctomycetota bacterium]
MGHLFRSSLCSLLLFGSVANAQAPEKYFGFGLESFYQADYEGAVAHLDRAESLGMSDARMYLYRGIAKIRAGQDEGGRIDLQTAAKHEARLGTRYVGRFSERLDGTERQALSDYRAKARGDLRTSLEAAESNAEGLVAPGRISAAQAKVNVALADDSTDPFLDDSLGRGEIVAATVAGTND